MTDIVSRRRRSLMISKIKSKNTKPELIVRSLIHGLGYRFRLHRKELLGKPDLCFPSLRKVVYVNGCFWHSNGCSRSSRPKTNTSFWLDKLIKM